MQTQTQEPSAVLVVDDNPLIVNVLQGLLGSDDYKVYSCSNGEEALEMLADKCVDLIICDVMMPKMDGYELHDMLRKKPELSHIPFVFLTALGGEEVRKGKELGADDYIVKPFDPKELLSIVRGKVCRSKNLKNLSEQQYDHFRKKIIHTLSHEFRTPLVAINTGTELLIEQEGTIEGQKAQNLLAAIQRGGRRLERLVTDFMIIQQIEAGIAERLFHDRSSKHDVRDILEAYFDSKKPLIEGEGFTFRLNCELSSPEVMVYEPHIIDAIDRLVDNAVKFSPERKEVEIFAYNELGNVVIEVRDRGVGVDPSQLRRAIDLFGQVDREKLEQQGGGFGLAIVSRYLGINKGSIDFRERSGGGLSAIIQIPVHETSK